MTCEDLSGGQISPFFHDEELNIVCFHRQSFRMTRLGKVPFHEADEKDAETPIHSVRVDN